MGYIIWYYSLNAFKIVGVTILNPVKVKRNIRIYKGGVKSELKQAPNNYFRSIIWHILAVIWFPISNIRAQICSFLLGVKLALETECSKSRISMQCTLFNLLFYMGALQKYILNLFCPILKWAKSNVWFKCHIPSLGIWLRV